MKEGPDSSKISTTTEDSKDHDASLGKSLFGESDSAGRRTEKTRADSRQSPITLISSTTRSGEELKSPGREQAKTDDCRTVSKENYMPLTVQTDGAAHLNQNHLHNFGFPPGLAGQQFFNHLGGAHPFLLHPSQFNMGGAFSNMAAGMGPILAAVSSGGVSSMDTNSMPSPSQSLAGAPLPFHLQQHMLASQVRPLMMISKWHGCFSLIALTRCRMCMKHFSDFAVVAFRTSGGKKRGVAYLAVFNGLCCTVHKLSANIEQLTTVARD